MEEELAQIAADGFNSIVLVIPWREFQPGVLPVSYNRYRVSETRQVMIRCAGKGTYGGAAESAMYGIIYR